MKESGVLKHVVLLVSGLAALSRRVILTKKRLEFISHSVAASATVVRIEQG